VTYTEKTLAEEKITNALVTMLEGDIVHIHWNDNIDIARSDIEELEVAFQQLTDGRLVKAINHMGRYTNISSDARAYGAERSPELIALAYVIHGLAQRIAVRFYLKLRRRSNPTKVFENLDDALEWLRKR